MEKTLINKYIDARIEISRLNMELSILKFRLETLENIVDEALSKDADDGQDRHTLELLKAAFICFQ